MTDYGFTNLYKEPMARWLDTEDAQASILNQPLRFPYASNVVAPNRIMKSAMSEQLARFCCSDVQMSGIPTHSLINLYQKFGDGGFGIIVTGCINVNANDLEAPGNVIIDKHLDSDIRREAFNEWTQAAKRNGSIFIAQLFHPGNRAANLPFRTNFDVNRITRQQIYDLINDYAYAASYAQQCGFDGVEITSAYYYALGQFITSGSNSRTDEFGGALDNRSRVLFKIIQAIRMRLQKPSSFVIGLKLFAGNFEPAFNESEFGEFIHNVEKTGFDYMTITGGDFDLLKTIKPNDENAKIDYFYQQFAINAKKNLTRTKLFMNRGFVTIGEMCDAVSSGWAAGISIGRPVAAEPDLARKLLTSEVKSAAKSLFDPLDFPVEKQFVGTQLWQQGTDMKVMDASNPHHVDQFKKELHLHEKQRHAGGLLDELLIGYPKAIITNEMYENEFGGEEKQPLSKHESVPKANGQTPTDGVETKFEDALEHVQTAYDDGAHIVADAVKNATNDLIREHETLHDYSDHEKHSQLAKDAHEFDTKNDTLGHPMHIEQTHIELDEFAEPQIADTQLVLPIVSGLTSNNQLIVNGVREQERDQNVNHSNAQAHTYPEIHVVHSEPQVIDDDPYDGNHSMSNTQAQPDTSEMYGGFAKPEEEKHADASFVDSKQQQPAIEQSMYDAIIQKSFGGGTQFDDNFGDTSRYIVSEHSEYSSPSDTFDDNGYRVSTTTTTTTLFGTSSPEGGDSHQQHSVLRTESPDHTAFYSECIDELEHGRDYDQLHSNLANTDAWTQQQQHADEQDELMHTKHMDDDKSQERLAGFISSAIPDSVQNLFSTIKKGKQGDTSMMSTDEKPVVDVREEFYTDPEQNYEVHRTVTKTTYETKDSFGEPASNIEFKPPRSDAESEMGEGSHMGSIHESHGDGEKKRTEKHSSKSHHRLFGQKNNDDLDFEFIH